MTIDLICANRTLTLDRPVIMGILNVTPDSFSDGGRFANFDNALRQAESMVAEGAHIIDVGGESTRPGANAVAEQQEMDRVLPIIETIASRLDAVISIDTSKPAVMLAAAKSGAGLINDVRALQEPGALQAASDTKLPVCLMHMQGEPRTMQAEPYYDNVVAEVKSFLQQRLASCIAAGIDQSQVIIDPGFGFGKNYTHNWTLLRELDQLVAVAPVLTGLSRKRMIGDALGSESADRTIASATAAMVCVHKGASIVRVHDVAETRQAIAIAAALNT